MINKINLFFKQLWEETSENKTEISIEIAAAVLLCEIMKADGHCSPKEETTLTQLLTLKFSLSSEDVKQIIAQALVLSENATDFYQFTSRINDKFTIEQKIIMMELLWTLAYSDGKLDAIEEHLLRKIADLLHLRHHEYISAKTQALEKYNADI